MHYWIALFKFFVSACFVFFSILSNAGVAVGDKAPEISGKLLNEADFSLTALKGKVVLINFWASWCEPCREEMPLIEAFYMKHKKDGFEVLAISMDNPRDLAVARKILKNYSFISAHKSDLNLSSYGRIWRIPSTFVIDRQGLIIKDGLVGKPTIDEEVLHKEVLPALLKN